MHLKIILKNGMEMKRCPPDWKYNSNSKDSDSDLQLSFHLSS